MSGSSSRTRTCDHPINSRTLYQLSYRGSLGGAIANLMRRCKRICYKNMTFTIRRAELLWDHRNYFDLAIARTASSQYQNLGFRPKRPRGGVVTQRTANPCTGVRFPPRPPIIELAGPEIRTETCHDGRKCTSPIDGRWSASSF